MAMRPASRAPVGSAAWCVDERSSSLQITRSEVEEFSYSARNEVEWLNEHMADVFSENNVNVADIFKTPGKLRGKTPRTTRKVNQSENRVPLSDIFSATPKGTPNPFSTFNSHHARTPTFRIAEDKVHSPVKAASASQNADPSQQSSAGTLVPADSGYYGSQNQDAVLDFDLPIEHAKPASPEREQQKPNVAPPVIAKTPAPEKAGHASSSFEEAFEPAKQEWRQTENVSPPVPIGTADEDEAAIPASSSPVHLLGHESPDLPLAKSLSPEVLLNEPALPVFEEQKNPDPEREPYSADADEVVDADVTHSPSDGSSPIRPMVRKSSLNFASLPAREPLTSNKSLGGRMSRTSHIDQARSSYYPRQTGGKSLGVRQEAVEENNDVMDVDDEADDGAEKPQSAFVTHSKSYTQRLQDQISMLGKSQTGGTRPSKSIPNLAGTQQMLLGPHTQIAQQAIPPAGEMLRSPVKPQQQAAGTPGAFPEDTDDDWIAPPTTKQNAPDSLRPALTKSRHVDVEEMHEKGIADSAYLVIGKDQLKDNRPGSPQMSPQKPPSVSHAANLALGHGKSISVPALSRDDNFGGSSAQELTRKVVSVSNSFGEKAQAIDAAEPPKSPSRTFRESPLKQVKHKFSAILKGSKGLMASSAALSAEGKASLINSPSSAKVPRLNTKSTESLIPPKGEEPLYPDLAKLVSVESQTASSSASPSRANSRKTRASAERERKDQKQKEKEDKEAQHLADQMDKLEKAREKEREKAATFNQERQKKVTAEKKTLAPKDQEMVLQTPAPKEANKPTRTSPRKIQANTQSGVDPAVELVEADVPDQDIEMSEAPSSKAALPSIPRPTPGQSLKSREIKRPTKPTRDLGLKPKQAPTLIRVNTSSQHPGFHPSNSLLSATLQDTLGSTQQSKSKAGQPSLQSKSSVQSLKSSVNSTTGRPKALELAEKRRQEEEQKAQRKRDMKAEMERKRQEDRRLEEERREKERQRIAAEEEAKKAAARQAAIEKAKQTKAPPPAVRTQPSGPPASRAPSRLGQSTMHRSQEDAGRPVNAVLASNTAKMSMKRPLQQDGGEDSAHRTTANSRAGPSQQKEAKRMRMSDEFDPEEEMEIQSYGTNIKGPPVRPSAGFKKDVPNKSHYTGGYAPAPQGVTRDIFKAPVPSHHSKSGHPLDMAQISKGPITFASSQHAAGSSHHKTPARSMAVMAAKSAAKSATRSSPRFQNGENIELPEIQTDDDEDDEDDHKGLGVASWADTPELRRELMKQETVDPLQVFGPPAPLKLEEVFKNKDRWSKFRARTSSANWNGNDRLTEDEIRKDLAARERMRRDGGWSYQLGKDMA